MAVKAIRVLISNKHIFSVDQRLFTRLTWEVLLVPRIACGWRVRRIIDKLLTFRTLWDICHTDVVFWTVGLFVKEAVITLWQVFVTCYTCEATRMPGNVNFLVGVKGCFTWRNNLVALVTFIKLSFASTYFRSTWSTWSFVHITWALTFCRSYHLRRWVTFL